MLNYGYMTEASSLFQIRGGRALKGEVPVYGAKNAALKMMAAALLTTEDVVLHNVPDIRDITMMAKVLESLGASVKREIHTLTINAANLTSHMPDRHATKHLRASVIVAGPLLARLSKVAIHQPGGCAIGARPIDIHLSAFQQMGASWHEEADQFVISGPLRPEQTVILDDLSVGATENTLLAAAGTPGRTTIRQAVVEPEIGDLICLLEAMGAKVHGKQTSVLTIDGKAQLHGAEYTVMPDRIEAGTFLMLAAATRGRVTVRNMEPHHLDGVLQKLKKANVKLDIGQSEITVEPTTHILPVNVTTQVYPGFPTDLQATMAVLLTQAEGASRIFETIFDGRLGYAGELSKMGAHLSAQDSHTLLVYGPTPLYGRRVTTIDLRAGATLVIAALLASGESVLEEVEILDRGYERLEERLRQLGADIVRLPGQAVEELSSH